jgi:hypothetical protein
MELFDDPESSIITAQVEVPGMKTSDVSLQIQEERLVVSGERRPTLAVGERRNGDEAPVQPATDSGTQTPVPAGNTPNTPTPHPNKFPVQELKYGKFLREICIPTGLRVCQSCTFCLEQGTHSHLYRSMKYLPQWWTECSPLLGHALQPLSVLVPSRLIDCHIRDTGLPTLFRFIIRYIRAIMVIHYTVL